MEWRDPQQCVEKVPRPIRLVGVGSVLCSCYSWSLLDICWHYTSTGRGLRGKSDYKDLEISPARTIYNAPPPPAS